MKLKADADSLREISHTTTTINGVKYAIVRGVNEKGQRYLDQYDLETKLHEKRPLQGGADALVVMSDGGLMAITSGGKMQVFNMAARQVVSSAQLPALANGEANSIKFWKFATAQLMVICGSDAQVYTWHLATANAAPAVQFKLNDALLIGPIVDIQVSEDEQWYAVVMRSLTADGKQQVQMTSVARAATSVLEASSAVVYTHPTRGCSVMAVASKGSQGWRLIVAELASAPGTPKFERLVLEIPGEAAHVLPACILRQGMDPNILTVVSQQGHVHVANTETRSWIAQSRLSPENEDIFTGASSPGFNHLVVISSKGSLYVITTRGTQTASAAAPSVQAPSTPPATPALVPSVTPPPTASNVAASTTAVAPVPTASSFGDLSLQSMVEPRKPVTPLEEFFSVYPAEALSIYKNQRAQFLPYFKEHGLQLNWQGLMLADKDMSVASKLAFGHALAHLEIASRSAIVSHFESLGYLNDTHEKTNYMIDILTNSNSPADSDLQTNAIVLGLSVTPSVVVSAVIGKKWTHFDPLRVSEAAIAAEQWDLVWLLATSFDQRLNLIAKHCMSIAANQILQWYNGLPADGAITVLDALFAAQATHALSWERVAAPPNDRLAPHLDLAVSPPFQTLRVKVAAAANPSLWERYIDTAIKFGEDKEISRILLQFSADKTVTDLAETAVKKAAAAGSLVAALPLLLLAEKSNKVEDLVMYHLSRPDPSTFLVPYVTTIQPQNSARVIALVAEQQHEAILSDLILESTNASTVSAGNLWLAANQNGSTEAVSRAIGALLSQGHANTRLMDCKSKFSL